MADTETTERLDPTRLMGRWTVGALALAGAALVLLPSAQFGWDPIKGGWAATPTRVLLDLTALIGVAIAAAACWSQDAHRAARLLGAALALLACAWGWWSADAAIAYLAWRTPVVLGVSFVGLAFLSAFFSRFPRTVTAADYHAHFALQEAYRRGDGPTVRQDPFAALEAPTGGWDRLKVKLGLPVGDATIPTALRPSDRTLDRLIRDQWAVLLALVPVVVAIAASPWRKLGGVLVAAMAVAPLLVAIFSRVTALRSSEAEHRHWLWIAAGVVAGMMVLQASFVVFIACGYFDYFLIGLGIHFLGMAAGALLFVLGLAMAVFGTGALDPRLAIKRSLVSGIVATLLTFTFALVEAFVATFFAEQLGLPTAAAPAVASAAVAVALGPMWKKVSGWVGGKLGAPATA